MRFECLERNGDDDTGLISERRALASLSSYQLPSPLTNSQDPTLLNNYAESLNWMECAGLGQGVVGLSTNQP